MKKILALLLAAMCLSLCACGGDLQSSETKGKEDDIESNTTSNNTETNAQNTTETTAEDNLSEILCSDWWQPITMGTVPLVIDEDGTTSAGTWVLTEHGMEHTDKYSGEVEQYQLECVNDIWFLIGERVTYTFVPAEVPSKSVEITIDNWQEYLEFGYDNHTDTYRPKLKDNYRRILLWKDCTLTMKYSQNGVERETSFDFFAGLSVGEVSNPNEFPVEMIEIQGTLFLVDGL